MTRMEDKEDLVGEHPETDPTGTGMRQSRLTSIGRAAGRVRKYSASVRRSVRKTVDSIISGGELDETVDPWALSELQDTTQPWSELTTRGKLYRVLVEWIGKPVTVLVLLYLFICSLDLMSSAFRLLGGKEAGEVFSESTLLNNPICGLMIGILATVLVQSSSTSTSIVVSIVSAGILQVEPAIFIIMGANIGTSVTNTIVSLAQSGNRNEFRRAFGGATIHDMFNWLSVICLLPLECATKYLYHMTNAIVGRFNVTTSEGSKVELLKVLTKPFSKKIIDIDSKVVAKIALGKVDPSEAKLLKEWCKKEKIAVLANTTMPPPTAAATVAGAGFTGNPDMVTEYIEVGVERCSYLFANTGLSERGVGAILLILTLILLCTCLILMVKLLNSILKGRMAGIIKRVINADFPYPFGWAAGYLAILVGAGVTFLVQSSSVFTSAMTPLVGLGVITLDRVYPMTLGSNIGTTATSLLAAMASSGDKLKNSLQIALCHLFFNISGILLWYPLPFMRKVPIFLAKTLGNTTAKYRWFAIFYLVVMFFLVPLVVFGLSLITVWLLLAVGLPVLLLGIFVIVVNVLQRKKPDVLPKKLRNWDALPLWMHSLAPMDRLITRVLRSLTRCCPCKRNKEEADKDTLPLHHSTEASNNLAVHYDAVNERTSTLPLNTSPSNHTETRTSSV
ncbi:sodium-dependent phosphate transport protein 2B-like [Acanthaster planci]|uniref:Sodium-dependent phosphate transport protein 2B-like n=1 Tax=Acanthaster planci TaxID=133434 RepID=A0A8B7XXG6_ACAPL|nr:sodium-dependent phosphate transport protein 2B-like [Acanthaster planci]